MHTTDWMDALSGRDVEQHLPRTCINDKMSPTSFLLAGGGSVVKSTLTRPSSLAKTVDGRSVAIVVSEGNERGHVRGPFCFFKCFRALSTSIGTWSASVASMTLWHSGFHAHRRERKRDAQLGPGVLVRERLESVITVC